MAGQRNSYGKRSRSQSDYPENGSNKRRHTESNKDSFTIGPEDTVYRYLCPVKKIGSIIGRGGEIIKQLRADTKSKIRIGESIQGCDERVVTIYSSNQETNDFDNDDDRVTVCPSQDALFKVHDRIIVDDSSNMSIDDDTDGSHHITVRLLVASDQIGCIIGKGGIIVQNIRSDTGANVRILKDEHLPSCGLRSDELVQISGEGTQVRKALFQIASRLHDNPSRTQHLLASLTNTSAYPMVGPTQIMGLTPLVGPYSGYQSETRSIYSRDSRDRDQGSSKDFSLRMVCPTANIGSVIGKSGVIINQIRQESGAAIKVDSSRAEGDDCVISISSKEFFEETFSPTIEAALRLQPRCSEKIERDSGLVSHTTRLLVPTSRIGCLIGKGGSIITEMRRISRANIRILSKESLPKVADNDEEVVQISGDLDLTKDALVQVTSRLRANLFDLGPNLYERESGPGLGPVQPLVPVLPYLPSESLKYETRDSKRRGHGYDLPSLDSYGSYGSQSGHSSTPYGVYGGGYSTGRSSYSRDYSRDSGRLSGGRSPVSRRKSYGY